MQAQTSASLPSSPAPAETGAPITVSPLEKFRPPAPAPKSPVAALVNVVLRGERDLLSLLPATAYTEMMTPLGRSRRGIVIVNRPDLVVKILADPEGIFPKNDLMVGALAPLVGDSIFVSDGERWRRQRRMIDPAFSHMRINRAFESMAAAIDDYETRLDEEAARGTPFSLDAAMSHLTADIICRTIFSRGLETQTARDVFDSFLVFERSVANVNLTALLFGRPWAKVEQPREVLDACARIRRHIGAMLAPRRAADAPAFDDIASAIIAAVDPETGERFSEEELIDQLGVFFLAGHETTASVLTWCFFIIAQLPAIAARMRAEIARIAGDGPIGFEAAKKLVFVRNVFREAARLYPPITFLPRVAARATDIGGRRIARGTMVMIAPWAIHRHRDLWPEPDRFDPDRFAPEREHEIEPGSYIPFGIGPRVCVGAAFATVEATLILARLVRRYDFAVENPEAVRPVARLTTRPKTEITARVRKQPPDAA
jgi:cytochrome P450